jgi:outer membrane protein TolC
MKIKLTTFFLFLGLLNSQAQESFSLQQAVDYAIRKHSTMKLAELNMQDADQSVKEYRAIGIPQVTGGINYQYYLAVPQQPIVDFITPSVYEVLFDENVLARRDLGPPNVSTISFFQPHNLTGSIEVSSMLFDGSYLYGLKAAKLYRELALKQVGVSEQEIKSNVTKAYYATLIAQENLKVLQNNSKTVEKSLSDAKVMFENGFLESLDVDRLQLSNNRISTEIQKIEDLIEISLNVLKFQMEYPISSPIALTDDINSITLSDNAEYTDAPLVNYNDRAEYEVLNTNISLNELNLKRIKAGYYPTLRAFGNVQTSLQRSDLFDDTEAGWINSSGVGLAINIPIYDGGARSAQSQRSEIDINKIKLQKSQFENAVNMQVSNAWLSYKSAKKEVEFTKSTLTLTENIYQKSNIKFQEGVGSSVELSQAETELYAAQGNYINAIYQLINTKADLEIALGKL